MGRNLHHFSVLSHGLLRRNFARVGRSARSAFDQSFTALDCFGKFARKPVCQIFIPVALSLVVNVLTAGVSPLTISAKAQNVGDNLFAETKRNSPQMLLEADELVYDDASQSVAAVGNVQIAYDGHTLVARQVIYNRTSGRVLAQGNVQIVEPDGNRIYAEEIDITDNFSDGFVSSLRLDTADNTRFAADSAERIGGTKTILKNGVYTACEVCKENPEKPPLWQVRAQTVTVDSDTKEVSYKKATFELYGKPIAYLPYFSHADPSVKRKSGFLMSSVKFSEKLGYSANLAYFFNLAPNYDLTLASRYYSKQGFLGRAVWRHRTNNGAYNIRFAGIHQNSPDEFDAGTYDIDATSRYSVQSSGKYDINTYWTFGWQWLYQSDRDFTLTYGLNAPILNNEVYLRGLKGKNYFDLSAQKFIIQEAAISSNRQPRQAGVTPLVDHNYVVDTPVVGGQLSYNFNNTTIDRHVDDIANSDRTVNLQSDERHYGIIGEHTRSSAELEWKSKYISNSGLEITPSLHGRVDGIWQDTVHLNSSFNPLLTNESLYRAMPTAGLEIRYPLIAQGSTASHVFQPIGQIFASTDETQIGKFTNEDAQSMVFDASNLFTRNRFSGYDRIEGGVRANVGFMYSANFLSGSSIDVVAGQSYHLAGLNSFAQRDLVNAGIESGLDTKHSDYVAGVNYNTGYGLSVGTAGRFSEKDFELRKADVGISYNDLKYSASANYTFIDAQPNYGFKADRHQINTRASMKFAENWRVFGGVNYDLEAESIISDSLGLAYEDSCYSFSVTYTENRTAYTGRQSGQALTFNIGLRTIGQYSQNLSLDPYLNPNE